ncbi:MAG: glutamine--fructose-6-phosphate transaminase (isomerizing) [Verrucomicrobiae bacterium]|nr:glutamine--fructose-6-phosphate transaminase (isomerizing) [Verrucomicrobiae bacterium]
MCGIVACIGTRPAAPLLVEGLRRLEYRGYDSAGVGLLRDGKIETRKRAGRIDALAALLAERPISGTVGISHTRWATHGPPTDMNSHPHLDATGKIAVVHNGVIENHAAIRRDLEARGETFVSDTDTEALARLLGQLYAEAGAHGEAAFLEALRRALRRVSGAYGLAILCADCPDAVFGARKGSPLIVGIGREEHFLASDVNAIVAHTREVAYLADGDLAVVRAHDFEALRMDDREATVAVSRVEHDAAAAEKGDFPHFMLKEIFEQPHTLRNALRGRLNPEDATSVLGGLNMTAAELRGVERIQMAACGTSWHAGLLGEMLIEEFARIPCEVDYASEFRYRNPPFGRNTLFLAITQSGETADTLAALREAKRKGARVLGICNVVGSSIAREAGGGLYLHAGPEIGVASTKAFTSQVTALALLALYLGRLHHLSALEGARLIRDLENLPGQIEEVLAQSERIRAIAQRFRGAASVLFLGRRFNYPVALEGALKLKEISYIHAEGYPAAEMKHGPIALVDERTPSVFLCPRDGMYEKTLNNLEEVRARRGPVIAVATEGDREIAHKAEAVIPIPAAPDHFAPLLANVALQLFAYHAAVALGRDVDKPRNLAKSVTVE